MQVSSGLVSSYKPTAAAASQATTVPVAAATREGKPTKSHEFPLRAPDLYDFLKTPFFTRYIVDVSNVILLYHVLQTIRYDLYTL